MLWRVGDMACHYLSSNKPGKVISIINEKPTTWFVGGTPDIRTFLILEYKDGTKETISTGDAIKIYN
jgi:hypothetical protein